MFIQTEYTPNPATLKFLPGREVMTSGTADFADAASSARSPMAEALFGIDGIERVFLGSDFVTVTKREGKEWAVVKPAVLGAIMDHYTSGKPVIVAGGEEVAQHGGSSEENSEIVEQIIELLDTRIRPQVAQDGGDITFKDFKDGVVTLYMQGACSGCPSSTATLKMGIENMLKHYIPEVLEVRAEA
jgi:Fe-S cluster biogenesis protein NfuA